MQTLRGTSSPLKIQLDELEDAELLDSLLIEVVAIT